MRVLLDVSFIGTRYSGWQSQENAVSVQDVLEKAFLEATGTFCRMTGASRTDAGVHARCLRVHLDYDGPVPADRLPFVINRFLPGDIRVNVSRQVPDDLHARFKAEGKTYIYRIDPSPHPNALSLPFSWHFPYALDVKKMASAAADLIGTHDFIAFAAAGFQSKTTVKTITRADVGREDQLVVLTVTGTGFLYNMVRIIAGTLAYVGIGKLDEDCIQRAIRDRDRLLLGPTAPPEGLELNEVYYSPAWGIADITKRS